MNPFFLIAAILAIAIGVAHTLLGEKYVVGRVLALDVPRLGHGPEFMRQVVRFAWHLTSVLLIGFGLVLFNMAQGVNALFPARTYIGLTFAVCALLSLIATRGRHLSWIVFAGIAVLTWMG